MMAKGTMTSKGQITIPKEIREFLALSPGNTVRFITRDDGTCTMVPVKAGLDRLYGMLPPPAKAASIEDMDDAVKKAVAERFLRDRD